MNTLLSIVAFLPKAIDNWLKAEIEHEELNEQIRHGEMLFKSERYTEFIEFCTKK